MRYLQIRDFIIEGATVPARYIIKLDLKKLCTIIGNIEARAFVNNFHVMKFA